MKPDEFLPMNYFAWCAEIAKDGGDDCHLHLESLRVTLFECRKHAQANLPVTLDGNRYRVIRFVRVKIETTDITEPTKG